MNTYTYTVTRDQIVIAALRKLGVVEPMTILSSSNPMLLNAVQVFNLMVKQMAADGLKIWTIDQMQIPLTANKSYYSVGSGLGVDITYAKPLKLVQAWIRNSSVTPMIDTPLQILSQQEYNILGSKGSSGVLNSIYMDARVDSSIFYTYLTPDVYTATTYYIYVVFQRMMADVQDGAVPPDFPVEWMQTLIWGLADQLAIEYDVPANHRQEIAMRAAAYVEKMASFDIESTSTFFVPDVRFGNHR